MISVENITQKSFKNCMILYVSCQLFLFCLLIFSIGTRNMYFFSISTLSILLIIGGEIYHFKNYLNYKNKSEILYGIILNVHVVRACTIVVEKDRILYKTSGLLYSKVKNMIGKKCSFIIKKDNKIYVKDIYD